MLCERNSWHVWRVWAWHQAGSERGSGCWVFWRPGWAQRWLEGRSCMLTSPACRRLASTCALPLLLHSFAPLSPQLLCRQLTLSMPAFPNQCPFQFCQSSQLHFTPSVFMQSVRGLLRKLNLTKEQIIHDLLGEICIKQEFINPMGLLKDGFRKKSLGVLLF